MRHQERFRFVTKALLSAFGWHPWCWWRSDIADPGVPPAPNRLQGVVRVALTAAQPALEAAGAAPSAHAAKLARALGPAWPEARTAEARPARKKGPLRDVVTSYVGAQLNELLTHDAGVRQDVPDSVHQMRSAARRTRSVLWTYRTLFTKGAVAGLERDLQRLGRILGRPRDAEVMRERILANLHALPERRPPGLRSGRSNTNSARPITPATSAPSQRLIPRGTTGS